MEIGSDLWNARVYAGLSQASLLAAWLDSPRSLSFSLHDVWKMSRILNRLNRSAEEIIAAFDRAIELRPAAPLGPDATGGEYVSIRDRILDIQVLCARALSFQTAFSRYGLLRKKLA
jgi:hypothetical protein